MFAVLSALVVVSSCFAETVTFTELLPETLHPSGAFILTETLCVPTASPDASILQLISDELILFNNVSIPTIITSIPEPSSTTLYPDGILLTFISPDDI